VTFWHGGLERIMTQSFLYLWTRQEFETHRADGEGMLWSASGNMFRQRGLAPGDAVYVVSCFDEKLFLLGRIDVSQILSPTEARAYTSDDEFPWDWATDHIFCDDEAKRPMLFDLVVPGDRIRTMQFEDGRSPVYREDCGRVIPDPQTFRGFRRLSWQTAADFDRLLAARLGSVPR
jgi:hypothetical protein